MGEHKVYEVPVLGMWVHWVDDNVVFVDTTKCLGSLLSIHKNDGRIFLSRLLIDFSLIRSYRSILKYNERCETR